MSNGLKTILNKKGSRCGKCMDLLTFRYSRLDTRVNSKNLMMRKSLTKIKCFLAESPAH